MNGAKMNLNADARGEVSLRIQRAVTIALNELPIWQRWWVRAHLVAPKPVVLCTNPETLTQARFWLVTDHVGLDDAPFRIVFDGIAFGLEMTLEDGLSYLVYRADSFAQAVECL